MILLIDSNAVGHMIKHTMGHLSYEYQKVGIIFGFMKQIMSLYKKFKSKDFIFVWDSKISKRKEIYPGYKERRRKILTEEEKVLNELAYKQFEIIKTYVLPKLGFINNFTFDGYEGDDIIAKIAQNNHEMIKIISSDNDLYQLLSKDIWMYLLNKKELYTDIDFMEEWGIKPAYWSVAKAIAGCPGDDVFGIKGVGEKTACKYILGILKKESKAYQNILKGYEIIQKNKEVVTLPFPGLPKIELKKDELSYKGFLEICSKFGFQSFTYREERFRWKEFLTMIL